MGVYPTPGWPVCRLLECVDLIAHGTRWLELGAGQGDIIRAVNDVYGARRPDWTAVETRPECEAPLRALGAEVVIDDARKTVVGQIAMGPSGHDVAILNPDYDHAVAFIRAARFRARITAALLRLDYLGSAKRLASFRDDMPSVYVLPDRPTYVVKVLWREGAKPTLSTSDNCESAWFVWDGDAQRKRGTLEVLESTPSEVRQQARRQAPLVIEDERAATVSAEETLASLEKFFPWLKEHRGPVSVIRKVPARREETVNV